MISRRAAAGIVAVTLGAALSGCSGTASNSGDSNGSDITTLRYLVPNAPGSGWDTTARTAARAAQDAGVVRSAEVFNVDGANGTVGLARLANESGNSEMVMQMGLGLVGAVVSLDTDVTLEDVTPIAKLVEDLEVVFVNADSPYDTIDDLVDAWREDPEATTIGGGSSPGGADHLVPMMMAEELGIEPQEVSYSSLGGSGIMPAVLGDQVDFAVTGAGDVVEQVKAGTVRALAVSGNDRLDELEDVPTLAESGIDVTQTNWRGVVAPPDLAPEETEALIDAFDALHESEEWADAITTNGWVDAYQSGDEFGEFVIEQDAQVRDVMKGLGL